ncbi:MAG: hypothetical protein NVS4B3_25010 [Gemmatimonadaceae bacterium]
MKCFLPLLAVIVVGGCDGFKEAMTAHVDVVARAGSQELSVTRLSTLMGKAAVPIPVTRESAKLLASLWVDYQLLGDAAAHGDSLASTKEIDEALWGAMVQTKVSKFHELLSKQQAGGDTATEAAYNEGKMLAARHILLRADSSAGASASDSVRRRAEALRAKLTTENFAENATKVSQDPGSARNGGSLGVFPRGAMVPEFDKALSILKPGQISPVIKTQFGYHIIQRMPYALAKQDFARQYQEKGQRERDSVYLTSLDATGKITLKAGAAKAAKAVALDADVHRTDNAVLGSSVAGELTAARLVRWLYAFPPRQRLAEQLAQAPDSVVEGFLKSVILRNEVILHQADSARIVIDSADLVVMRDTYKRAIASAWSQLGVDPKSLSDSAKTPTQRERVAGARVESYMDRLVASQTQIVEVPRPVAGVLRAKYDHKLNLAALDPTVERATKMRASADSAKRLAQPKSIVPLPGQGGPPAASAPTPPGASATPPSDRAPAAHPPTTP